MKFIEKYISPLIKNQFPDFYKEEGQLFITFVKAYYEWLENNFQQIVLENDEGFEIDDIIEQGQSRGKIVTKYGSYYLIEVFTDEPFKCNTLCNDLTLVRSSSGGVSFIAIQRKFNYEYLARRLPEFRDIDKTIDNFIVNFKNKYLPNIQFTTASNKQLFIKNSLDFYRAKGTERAVDLFFKLIYGFEAKVYYPADDIFKLSDNEWVNVEYLEIEQSDSNVQFVGQNIIGAKSKATAYVERLVRVRKNSRYISVIYLSNVEGSFETNETIYTQFLTTNVTTRVLGSLTELEITSSDSGFFVGETVVVSDGAGKSARARVNSIIDRVGVVNFELIDSGWGYTNNSIIIGSDKSLRLNDIKIESTDLLNLNDPYYQFETIQQDLVVLEANTVLPLNSVVNGYDSNNTLTFTGTIVNINSDTSDIIVNYNSATTNNDLLITTVELYTSDNTLSTDISSTNNISASANVIAFGNTCTITYTGNNIVAGDIVYQVNDDQQIFANAVVTSAFANNILNEKYINITRDTGMFRTNKPFFTINTSGSRSIEKISNTNIGLIDIVNDFYPNANTYGITSGTHSTSGPVSGYDTKAEFEIVALDNVTEYVNFYSNDSISSVSGNTLINESSYGLSGNTSLGFDDIIGDALTFETVELGSIQSIITRNPGNLYADDPFYIVYEPKDYHLERYDYEITYLENEKQFAPREIIIGLTSGATAIVTRNDVTRKIIKATRISLASDLSTSEDFMSGETILGQISGFNATIDRVRENRRKPRTGLNTRISSISEIGTGFAVSLQILDSGFGYYEDEVITLTSISNDGKSISAVAKLGRQGIGQGYHTSNKSFLSSNKYLHDNDFYQEYSYQVLTSLPFEIYKKTLIDVLHVSGTKPFGSYSSSAENIVEFDLNAEVTIITD